MGYSMSTLPCLRPPAPPRGEGSLIRSLPVLMVLLTLAGVGCASPEGLMRPSPQASTETPLTLQDLQFQEPRSAALHGAIRSHTLSRTGGWAYLPLRTGGNFVEEKWCGPSVAVTACASGAVANDETPGVAWTTVGTLFYPRHWPAVFGVEYRAADMAEPWGVRVLLNLRGRTVTGSTFAFQFLRFEGGKVVDRLEVPDTWSYAVDQTRFSVPLPAAPTAQGEDEARAQAVEAEVTRLLLSPESFTTTVLSRIEDLRREVDRGLDAHEGRKCVYGPYKGGGIPPQCSLVALSMEEEVMWASRAQQDLDHWKDLVQSHGPSLHARLSVLLPYTVWKPQD